MVGIRRQDKGRSRAMRRVGERLDSIEHVARELEHTEILKKEKG